MMDPEINDDEELGEKYENQQKSMHSCAIYVAIYGLYFFITGMCGVSTMHTLFTQWTLSMMLGVLGIYGGSSRNIIALEIFMFSSLIYTFVLSMYIIGYIMDHKLFSLLTFIIFIFFECFNFVFVSITFKLIRYINNPVIVYPTMTDCNQSYTYQPGPSNTYH